MLARSTALFLILLVAGCSDESPTDPAADAPPLRSSYGYGAGDARITLEPSTRHLALRFREGVPSSVAANFLAESGLEVQWDPANRYRVYLVRTADAFVLARELGARGDLIEYVGPAFEVAGCHGDTTHEVSGNRIIVQATGQAGSARRLLESAGARLVGTADSGDLYALPWRPAGELFDLIDRVQGQAEVQRAWPDLMGFGCPHL